MATQMWRQFDRTRQRVSRRLGGFFLFSAVDLSLPRVRNSQQSVYRCAPFYRGNSAE